VNKRREPPKRNRGLRSKHDAIETGVHGAVDGHTDKNGFASDVRAIGAVVAAHIRDDANNRNEFGLEGAVPAIHPLDIGNGDRERAHGREDNIRARGIASECGESLALRGGRGGEQEQDGQGA